MSRSKGSFSPLQRERLVAGHNIPNVFKDKGTVKIAKAEPFKADGLSDQQKEVRNIFPNTYDVPRVHFERNTETVDRAPIKVGVVLSGGQAPGGHNVIAGIYDYIKTINPQSTMIGFRDGPHGVFSGIYFEIDDATMDKYRNTGGFDMLGSGRHKIETPEQFEASRTVCTNLGLDGLVVIGGDDSNTNAAVLGEYFKSKGSKTCVVGCPKTIDGDLKNEHIAISFGFDTACRTYSEQTGGVMRDALSSQKYYHFVRLMGRSASHIALEVALQTKPNVCLIGEEVKELKQSLAEITSQMADVVEKRAKSGRHYGVVLLPEGLIEFIPEIGTLIEEINEILAAGTEPTAEALLGSGKLSPPSVAVFKLLPNSIRQQLLLDRDPHGNVQVAKIETEQLLASTVAAELDKRLAARKGEGKVHFAPQFHAFGYEGRSGLPSTFDADYCYSLGLTAAGLVSCGLASLMACVDNLLAPPAEWGCGGVPIPMMMALERRKGKWKPVITKALVKLDGAPFRAFVERRAIWAENDLYRCPGSIQFYVPHTVLNQLPLTLMYELSNTDPDPSPSLSLAKPTIYNVGDSQFLHTITPQEFLSQLEKWRQSFKPNVPFALQNTKVGVSKIERSKCRNPRDRSIIKTHFPHLYGQPLVTLTTNTEQAQVDVLGSALKVGIVYCGRQAPGGHNVVTGLYDAVSAVGGITLGFIGGTKGLLSGQAIELNADILQTYRNSGGLDLLGRTVDHIDAKDAPKIAEITKKLGVNALILMGGVRTQTDAVYLAEAFKSIQGSPSVIGVPSGIDGGLHGLGVEATVGFDSACHLYAQLVGNTCTDAASARKYWHFLRVMGTDPSHTTAEVALRTHPNYVLLGEEVSHRRQTLADITNELADVVVARSNAKKDFGVVLVPEGLVASIPEVRALIDEIGDISIAKGGAALSEDEVKGQLSPWAFALLASLPEFIKKELLMERQSDTRVQLSQIETERLLAELVEAELDRRKKAGTYKGKYSPVCSFLGYQARGATPSNFDCELGYALGQTAAHLANNNLTGYLATATGLGKSAEHWHVGGLPLTSLLVADEIKGFTGKPKIPSARVELGGKVYHALADARPVWAVEEMYENPGPVQYAGPTADARPLFLGISDEVEYFQSMETVQRHLDIIREACRPGCPSPLLSVAAQSMSTLANIIALFNGEPGSAK